MKMMAISADGSTDTHIGEGNDGRVLRTRSDEVAQGLRAVKKKSTVHKFWIFSSSVHTLTGQEVQHERLITEIHIVTHDCQLEFGEGQQVE
jgi:hypothetical protein